jgi:hypothetical protein
MILKKGRIATATVFQCQGFGWRSLRIYLFDDSIVVQNILRQSMGSLIDNELERLWKEAAVV